MKRTVWKWLFGISLILLFLLMLFTVGLWAMTNAAGVLFALLFMLSEDVSVSAIPFGEFMKNFVGSPLFYIYLADLAVLLGSIIALTVTRKIKK